MLAVQFDFLICSERSGSNLITRLLGAHSQICAPATTHLFRLLAENLENYGSLDQSEPWTTLCRDAADLFNAKLGHWQTPFTAESLAAETPVRTLDGLLRNMFERETHAQGKQQVFVKEIELFRYWSWLQDTFPTARYVYLVRDPRDMALSWKKAAALRGGVLRAAEVWHRDQTAYTGMVDALRQTNRVVELTYEQLVADPLGQLARVMRLLELEPEPAQLGFYQHDGTTKLAQSAFEYRNLERPVLQENAGKFRRELAPAEIDYVQQLCGELMQRWGYVVEPVDDNRRSLTELAAHLSPLEPHQKPQYAQVSESERQTRARWVEIRKRIESRRPIAAAATNGTPSDAGLSLGAGQGTSRAAATVAAATPAATPTAAATTTTALPAPATITTESRSVR